MSAFNHFHSSTRIHDTPENRGDFLIIEGKLREDGSLITGNTTETKLYCVPLGLLLSNVFLSSLCLNACCKREAIVLLECLCYDNHLRSIFILIVTGSSF